MKQSLVDGNEDANSSCFHTPQHVSTTPPDLIETKAIENGHFTGMPKSALGAGALLFGGSLDSMTWKDILLNLEETSATISTTVASGQLEPAREVNEFIGLQRRKQGIAHLLLRQGRGLDVRKIQSGIDCRVGKIDKRH